MKLTEWNNILSYADELCEKTNADLRPIVYTMSDGRMGIKLTLFDNAGNVFKEASSGEYDTADKYKIALYAMHKLICQYI